jgi:hypothetical protein
MFNAVKLLNRCRVVISQRKIIKSRRHVPRAAIVVARVGHVEHDRRGLESSTRVHGTGRGHLGVVAQRKQFQVCSEFYVASGGINLNCRELYAQVPRIANAGTRDVLRQRPFCGGVC